MSVDIIVVVVVVVVAIVYFLIYIRKLIMSFRRVILFMVSDLIKP